MFPSWDLWLKRWTQKLFFWCICLIHLQALRPRGKNQPKRQRQRSLRWTHPILLRTTSPSLQTSIKFGKNSDFIMEKTPSLFWYYHSSCNKLDVIIVKDCKEDAEIIQSLQSLKITKPKGKTNILVDMDTSEGIIKQMYYKLFKSLYNTLYYFVMVWFKQFPVKSHLISIISINV